MIGAAHKPQVIPARPTGPSSRRANATRRRVGGEHRYLPLGRRDLDAVAAGRPQVERRPPRRPRRAATARPRLGAGSASRIPPGPSPNSAVSPEQPRSSTRSRSASIADARPAIAISASAAARPPSLTSWAARTSPAADPLADEGERARDRARSRSPGSPSASSPRSFASSDPASEGANGPTRTMRSPSLGPRPRDGRRVGQLADHADDGSRVDRARARSRCRARRCRRPPGPRAPCTPRRGR